MQRHGRRFRMVRAASLALLLFTPAVAQAQVPWESPQMLAPGTPPGIGFYFVDFGLAPADGIGAMIMYRNQTAPGGTGLRFAGTRGHNEDEPRFSGGIDFTVPMFMHSPAFPLDVIWTSGIGASHGDYVQLALPVGFAAGRAIQGNTIWFNPYLSTRAVFEAYIGEDRPENAFGLALAADVGTDVSFGRGRSLVFRFAASLGDRHALVAGIHTAFGR